MLVTGKVRADLTAESAESVLVETLNHAESINQSINQSAVTLSDTPFPFPFFPTPIFTWLGIQQITILLPLSVRRE